jgi:hypothetical protein
VSHDLGNFAAHVVLARPVAALGLAKRVHLVTAAGVVTGRSCPWVQAAGKKNANRIQVLWFILMNEVFSLINAREDKIGGK